METAQALPVSILKPSAAWFRLDLTELWNYRELLYVWVWRDVKVRYKQTALGAAWAILQPTLTMLVFSVFFGRLAKVPSDGVPYPVFVFTALLPWQLFAFALTESSTSLVANQNLITKVYFPRLVIPIAATMASLVDFLFAFLILLALMLFYGIHPTAAVVFLPLFLVFALATALSAGLWLSALNVKYRDVRYTIPFLTQFWMFATPVAYPSSLVPKPWRALFGLNPMAGVVEGFRWALLGQATEVGPLLLVSIAAVAVLLLTGLRYFRKTEKTFADVI